MRHTKICPSCNKEFKRRSGTSPSYFKRRKYCSVGCSATASIKRNQPAPRLKKHCKACGEEFTQSRTCSVNEFKKRIYCSSSSCAQKDIKRTGINNDTRKHLNKIIENFKGKGEFRYRDISNFLKIKDSKSIRYLSMLIYIGMGDKRVVSQKEVYLSLTDKARLIEDDNKIIGYAKGAKTIKKQKKKKDVKKTKPYAINDMSTEFTGGYLKLMNNFTVRENNENEF